MNYRAFACLIACLFLNSIAEAHHSRANYDMQTFLEYEGTVVEFAWTNPHAFAVIDIDDGDGGTRRLLLEMNSKPILSRMGWSGDSLHVGDHIFVRGNPDRRSDRNQFFVRYVINRDEEKLWSFGRPREEAERFARENSVERKPLVGSTDFTGVWNRARLTQAERERQGRFGADELPVNEAGQAAFENYDVNDNPRFTCDASTIPILIVPVYPMEITWQSDSLLTIRYETNEEIRQVHIGETAFPEDVERSPMGYSIGAVVDGELEIHTRFFTPHRWGNGRGVPSSEQKEVFERYTLVNDGKRLQVYYKFSDPEFLTEPVERTGAYVLRNDYVVSAYSCDPGSAVRHLTGE